MRFLIIHQNFPAQFKNIGPFLAQLGHDVRVLTMRSFKEDTWQGVRIDTYNLSRGNTPNSHPWTVDFESKILRGEACLRACIELKKNQYYPDIILAHPGWGESLFLHNVWSDAKIKLYYEWYYHAHGYDVGFDLEFSETSPLSASRVELKNSNILLSTQHAHSGISPTKWQRSSFPDHIKEKVTVIHDGVDTRSIKPDRQASLVLESGVKLTKENEIVTFVSRTMEPYRGFHIFMRALPEILKSRPNVIVLIVGGESGGYGTQPTTGISWKASLIQQVYPQLTGEQQKRIHFLGVVPNQTFVKVLQVSTVHVYLTYPFVLSWSLLEAMGAGCTIIGSSTAPVTELLTDGETGVLIDFFNTKELAEQCIKLLEDRAQSTELQINAREHILKNYDLINICLPKQAEWAIA